jgi:hypothetical protein
MKNVSSHTADFKLAIQEVNGTMILPPLVFPEVGIYISGNVLVLIMPCSTLALYWPQTQLITIARQGYGPRNRLLNKISLLLDNGI